MTNFNYKRLDGLLLPGADYFRALQSHAIALEKEVYDLREARSKDGNRFYQRDAVQLKKENESLQREVYTLKCKLAELEGERKASKRDYENRIEALKENQVVEVLTVPDNKPRKANGQYINQGRTANNARECYNRLVLCQELPEDVAHDLGLSVQSVTRYARSYSKQLADAAGKARRQSRNDREPVRLADGYTIASYY